MSEQHTKPTLPFCWEVKECDRDECPLYKNPGIACWLVDNTLCDGQTTSFEDRFLMVCSRCPVFLEVRKRAKGRRLSDKAMLATFDRMVNNLYSYHISLRDTNKMLEQKVGTLRSVQELSQALLGSYKPEEVLYMVLTALTAGEGFAFNRAFLFLVDSKGEYLEGKLAVGPDDYEAASRIWSDLSAEKMPLKELMSNWDEKKLETGINKMIRSFRFALIDQENVLNQSLLENRIINVPDASSDKRAWKAAEVLKSNAFAVFPLMKGQRRIGVIAVDNFVTRNPILDEEIEPLVPFTSFAAIAVDNAALHEELNRQIAGLRKAHKRLRSQRKAIKRSQQLAEMGRLSADLAHEIRNPMTLIGGFARNIAKALPEDSELRGKAQIIADEVLRLETLLSQALTMTKEEKPNLELEDVNFLVMETLKLIESECEQKSIELLLDLSQPLPQVWMDRDRMKEVLINLIQNAMEAMPEGGILTLSTRQQDERILLSVADTGVGIPKSDEEMIFNPFYTTRASGTGLGLPLANRIIDAMSGSITVESEMGRGSTFTVSLPLKRRDNHESS